MILLCSDYDGTLHFKNENDSGYFKPEDLKEIKIFQDKGNLFSLCTGRIIDTIQDDLIKNMNIDYAIASTGGAIFDENFKEWHGMKGDFTAVTFFHSHCRIRECDVCKKMHLRVTSCGSLKQCIQSEEDDVDFRKGNIRDNIIKALNQPVNFDVKPARYVDTSLI